MKLNQLIAIEKTIKGKVHSEFTELHQVCQKPGLFNGFAKTYRKVDDASETLPSESQRVQQKTQDILNKASTLLAELIDITLAKDKANQQAFGEVEIEGNYFTALPVTTLLFLEKQLIDLRTFIDKLPTLDESEDWTPDTVSGLYKTATTATHRSKKIQKPIVLYPATPEHPAQTQLVTEDILAGYWDTIKHSAAIEGPRKETMLERVDKLLKAIKFAREEANGQEAQMEAVGHKLLDYILKV